MNRLAANERARVLPPPPPLRMTDEDEPLATSPTSPASPAAPADTAGRAQQQPRVRVAPEGGESLARPTRATPTSAAPTTPPSRPGAPRQAPQPPELPPVDLDRLIPTALTAASLARLAQQRQQPAADLSNVPTADYRGQPYTDAQRQRIAELGDDPDRGLLPHEGEAGLAAEESFDLRLRRYESSGLEFVDQHRNYWDVVSPMSIGRNGKPAFRLNQVVSNIKRHFLKGEVILDFGRLNNVDAEALRNAVNALSESERRGRQIIFVRDGG